MVQGVFVDANILYSRTVRDWLCLLRLGNHGDSFRLYTSHEVVVEALYHLRQDMPNASGSVIQEIRRRIEDTMDVVVTEFEVDGSFAGEDQHDAHVHAAALACEAQILLTSDAGFTDMSAQSADALPYEVYSPDDFFVLVEDSNPVLVQSVIRAQLDYWFVRAGQVDLSAALCKAGCPEFADRVQSHLQMLGRTTGGLGTG